MNEPTIGFVGAGQMATALAAGFVDRRLIPGDRIRFFDPAVRASELFAQRVLGSRQLGSNREVVAESQIVILAVKPAHFEAVTDDARPAVTPHQLFVSIMAGVTLQRLSRGLGSDRVIRTAPNTPCLIGCGATAFSPGPGVTVEDTQALRGLLGAVGYVVEVPEGQLDAVTGLSGSGPAFVYQFIEALADGGVRMGLARDVACQLAVHTVRGASQMVLDSGDHPAILKDRVASPAGTTMEGVFELECRGVRGAVIAAVEAAARRSAQLGVV